MEKHKVMFLAAIVGLSACLAVAVKNKYPAEEVTENQVTELVEPIVEEVKPEPKPEVKPDLPPKTYAEALGQAKAKSKKLLLVFYTDDCKFCKQLDSTLTDPKVQTALAGYLVYKVNSEVESAVASKYKVRHVPYYVVVNKETESAEKSGSGYKRPDRFVNWIED